VSALPITTFPSLPRWIAGPREWVEWFVVANVAFLAVDISFAHSVNRFATWPEWIPLGFSVLAPLLLLVAMPFGGLSRATGPGAWVGLVVGWASVGVGVAGMVLHLNSQFFAQQTLRSLVYTAPFAAPLAYTGVGLLLILNRMVDAQSSAAEWSAWIIVLALGGFVGNFVLSLADHAANGFYHSTEWIPVFSAALAIGFLLTLLFLPTGRTFLILCFAVMLLQGAVGLLGAFFHIYADWYGAAGSVLDSILYGAPPFAPLLFPNLALLAGIGLWSRYRITPRPADAPAAFPTTKDGT